MHGGKNLLPFLLQINVCGAAFISAEFTDISFEVKAELYLDFYAFRDVFRRNGMVQQICIASNRFELERTIPKN